MVLLESRSDRTDFTLIYDSRNSMVLLERADICRLPEISTIVEILWFS